MISSPMPAPRREQCRQPRRLGVETGDVIAAQQPQRPDHRTEQHGAADDARQSVRRHALQRQLRRSASFDAVDQHQVRDQRGNRPQCKLQPADDHGRGALHGQTERVQQDHQALGHRQHQDHENHDPRQR
jgi:hypothetical protein